MSECNPVSSQKEKLTSGQQGVLADAEPRA